MEIYAHSISKIFFAISILALVLTASGCINFQGGNDVAETQPPDEFANTQTETSTPKPTTYNISEVTEIQSQENEYQQSGQAFNDLIHERMEMHRTRLLDSRAFANNSVRLTVGLYNDTGKFADGSFRASAMDITQTVSTVVKERTSADEGLAMRNGTGGLLHQPKKVLVRVQDTDGEHVGNLEINSQLARAYMNRKFGSASFADHVLSSIRLKRDVEIGDNPPEWYLNLSQLRNWGLIYIDEVRELSDPSDDVFEHQIPTVGLSPNPEKMTVHHEIKDWDSDEMGQYRVSGEATIFGSYWRATKRSWALPPRRLKVAIHHVDKNTVLKGYMDREHVYELLSARYINKTTLTEYQESSKTKFIEDEG